MGNKKNGPGDGFRAWLTGQDNLGPTGKKWMGIVGPGLATIATAMGLQSRADKQKAFLKKNYPDTEYNKKKVVDKDTNLTMGDEFKVYRKEQRALPRKMRYQKDGGTVWTRNSRRH